MTVTQRGILNQRVASLAIDGRLTAASAEGNLQEGLLFGKSKHPGGFILAWIDGKHAAPKDFAEVGRVIENKGKHCGGEPVENDDILHARNERQPIVDKIELKQERGAPHDVDEKSRHTARHPAFVHPQKGQKQPERHRSDDGHHKDSEGVLDPVGKQHRNIKQHLCHEEKPPI